MTFIFNVQSPLTQAFFSAYNISFVKYLNVIYFKQMNNPFPRNGNKQNFVIHTCDIEEKVSGWNIWILSGIERISVSYEKFHRADVYMFIAYSCISACKKNDPLWEDARANEDGYKRGVSLVCW